MQRREKQRATRQLCQGLVQHEKKVTYIDLGGEDGRGAKSQKSKGRELEESHDGSRSRRQ